VLARLVVPLSCALSAALGTLPVASVTASEPPVAYGSGLATKKAKGDATPETERPELLATLVQTHTDERVMLDESGPSQARFAEMLADRVTGSSMDLDPRLLELIRALAKKHQGPGGAVRVELVSGFRSPKLNEMLRKKGHHVASHSQHSLGHAVDFRIVPGPQGDEAAKEIDPATLEQEIRALGWNGGVGVYLSKSDRFVHADVGPNRRWNGL
jgi:uncharacterized protein YcbK (DUF882 family)